MQSCRDGEIEHAARLPFVVIADCCFDFAKLLPKSASQE
jgi:hypothetical protein